jgi:hypothetical protein
MSRTARILSVLTLSIALFAVTISAHAQASVTQSNETVPINFIATGCNGETILADGESHVIQHSVVDASGNVHFEVHISFHLDAVAVVDGVETRYVINETVNGSNEFAGATTFTNVATLHGIANGSADDLAVRTTIRTIVNANGEVTSQTFEFETECRG